MSTPVKYFLRIFYLFVICYLLHKAKLLWFQSEHDETALILKDRLAVDPYRSVYDVLKRYQPYVKSSDIHLVIQWYFDKNITRLKELGECLKRNLLNRHIHKIHFIQPASQTTRWSIETFNNLSGIIADFPSKELNEKSIFVVTRDQKRLNIKEALRYVSTYLRGEIVLLSNLDIYFDETLSLLKTSAASDLYKYTAYFLSRYEEDGHEGDSIGTQCSNENFIGSHDVFVFSPPIPAALLDNLDLYQGSWGIEARMMFEFEEVLTLIFLFKAGIFVRNPCYDIKTWHKHSSGIKNEVMPEVNTNNRSKIAWPENL
jgi:hypothetical protein